MESNIDTPAGKFGSFGAPKQPVISENECYAALRLIEHMCDNIVKRGEVPKSILEFVDQTAKTIDGLNKFPTGKEGQVVSVAIRTGFLPTFHGGSTKESAGVALLELIEAAGA